MCKMDKSKIIKLINDEVRDNYAGILWAKVDKERIVQLNESKLIIPENVVYHGEDDYPLVGTIEFQIKTDNFDEDKSTMSCWFTLSPNNTVHIKEVEDGAEIQLPETIFVRKTLTF